MRGLRHLHRRNYAHLVNTRSPLNANLVAWYLCLPSRLGVSTWYNLVSYPAVSLTTGLNNGALTNFAVPFTSASGVNPTTRPNGYAHVAFDGTNDFVNCGNVVSGGGDCTVSMWVNVVSNLSGFDTLLGQGDTSHDFDLLLDAVTHGFAMYLN